MNYPAIIIAAYDRKHSLKRLLASVGQAQYPVNDIPLIISIDGGGDDEVKAVANAFPWGYGPKKVEIHPQHLGLKQHILSCGDLTHKYGNVIILEDDLMVSPPFYRFASEALQFYRHTSEIAGISLYQYELTENGFFPFVPLSDEFSSYFMQIPSSWGQAWSAPQWDGFRQWQEDEKKTGEDALPAYVKQWPDSSWKKLYFRYLMQTDRYIVYPRLSYSTNFGDPGTHTDRRGLFQVPLSMRLREGRLAPFSENQTRYDAWFELQPECLVKRSPRFNKIPLTMDLYGTKPPESIQTNYILTTRKSSKPEQSWAMEMVPAIQNVITGLPGDKIHLSLKEFVIDEPLPRHHYFYQTSSIHENIFNDLISQKAVDLGTKIFKDMKKDMEFRQQYPKFLIITPVIDHNFVAKIQMITAKSDYPNLIHAVLDISGSTEDSVFPPELHYYRGESENRGASVANIISDTNPVMIMIVNPGLQIHHNTPAMAKDIFMKYHHILWINSVGQPRLREYQCRWSRNRLRVLSSQIFNYSLNFCNVIFSRHLWELSREKILKKPPFNEISVWQTFAEHTDLFTLDRSFTDFCEKITVYPPQSLRENDSDPLTYPLIRKLLSATLAPGYRLGIPGFRTLYTELNRIPPMLRWDKRANTCHLEW